MMKLNPVLRKGPAAALIALLAGVTPASAERVNAGPVWEVGMGVEHVAVELSAPDVGAQIGAVLAGEYQVVAKGGIMGIGTSGGETAGGFGAYFLSLRSKWREFALEAGGALRKDTDEGGAAGLVMFTGRWYVSDANLGVRLMNATRRVDPPSRNTLTDRSVLFFISLER